jgi:hypothetical protein
MPLNLPKTYKLTKKPDRLNLRRSGGAVFGHKRKNSALTHSPEFCRGTLPLVEPRKIEAYMRPGDDFPAFFKENRGF